MQSILWSLYDLFVLIFCTPTPLFLIHIMRGRGGEGERDVYINMCTQTYTCLYICLRKDYNSCETEWVCNFYAYSTLCKSSSVCEFEIPTCSFLNNPDVLHLELVNPVTKAIFCNRCSSKVINWATKPKRVRHQGHRASPELVNGGISRIAAPPATCSVFSKWRY